MATPAELAGTRKMAKQMSTKDLEWQLANAERVGVTDAAIIEVFKEELKHRRVGTQQR